jgi:hypothetical protein
MEKEKIIEKIIEFSKTFENAKTAQNAFVFIPSNEKWDIYKIDKEIGLHAISAQALRDKYSKES